MVHSLITKPYQIKLTISETDISSFFINLQNSFFIYRCQYPLPQHRRLCTPLNHLMFYYVNEIEHSLLKAKRNGIFTSQKSNILVSEALSKSILGLLNFQMNYLHI